MQNGDLKWKVQRKTEQVSFKSAFKTVKVLGRTNFWRQKWRTLCYGGRQMNMVSYGKTSADVARI
jgi:hypothetical protein